MMAGAILITYPYVIRSLPPSLPLMHSLSIQGYRETAYVDRMLLVNEIDFKILINKAHLISKLYFKCI